MRWRGGWSGILIDWISISSVARTAFVIGLLGGGGVYWTLTGCIGVILILSFPLQMSLLHSGMVLSAWASLLCR